MKLVNDRPFAPPLREDDIQVAVFQHLRTRGAPGIVAWHTKNGGVHQRTKAQRAVNARSGVRAGVSDVIVIAPPNGRVYTLEIKTGKNKPTDEQDQFMADVRRAGGEAAWVGDLDSALLWLEHHGLLRGEVG